LVLEGMVIMHPVLFRIGEITVNSWGFMLAMALVLAVIGARRLFAREGYDGEIVLDLVIITVISGITGAHLLYMLLYERAELIANPLSFFYLDAGSCMGLVWYGAFIGGFLAFLVYLLVKQLPFWKIADMLAPFLALGYATVRIGCFLAGCCYGKISDVPWAVVFPLLDAFPRHPTQLYSSAANFMIFLFLLWFFPRRKFTGQVFILYLLIYPVYRFTVEFFRVNTIMYGPLSIAQLYSLIIFTIAVILYLWQRRRCKEEYIPNSGWRKYRG